MSLRTVTVTHVGRQTLTPLEPTLTYAVLQVLINLCSGCSAAYVDRGRRIGGLRDCARLQGGKRFPESGRPCGDAHAYVTVGGTASQWRTLVLLSEARLGQVGRRTPELRQEPDRHRAYVAWGLCVRRLRACGPWEGEHR